MSALLDLRLPSAERARLLSSLPELPELRASAVATWKGRMVNEHGSSRVFAALASQLERAGLAGWAAECRVFADEERRHGVLCGAVVEALGGEAIAEERVEHEFPLHEDAGELEAVARNVVSIGCLSETVAVALIGAERLEMPEGPLCELLTSIYADEVGHMRFGWRLLEHLAPRLGEAGRRRLSAYLRVAFGHLEAHELAHLSLASRPPPEGASLGLCSGEEARSLFYQTVEEAIVPALERHGLSAADAWQRRVAPRA